VLVTKAALCSAAFPEELKEVVAVVVVAGVAGVAGVASVAAVADWAVAVVVGAVVVAAVVVEVVGAAAAAAEAAFQLEMVLAVQMLGVVLASCEVAWVRWVARAPYLVTLAPVAEVPLPAAVAVSVQVSVLLVLLLVHVQGLGFLSVPVQLLAGHGHAALMAVHVVGRHLPRVQHPGFLRSGHLARLLLSLSRLLLVPKMTTI